MKNKTLQNPKKPRGQMSTLGEDLPAFILITIGVAMLLVAISGTWSTFNEKNIVIDEKKAVIEIIESVKGNGVINPSKIELEGTDADGNTLWEKWQNLDTLKKRYGVEFNAKFYSHKPETNTWEEILSGINFGPDPVSSDTRTTILSAPLAIKHGGDESLTYKNGKVKVTIWKK
ncbi:MAG: hypothetical protein J7K00_01980 [Candidatus Diapherotrites archaeon]|nr:hypothetical protein [Candidatus Diapherotrites archaeon]